MADECLKIEIRIDWWFYPYLRALVFFAETFDAVPDFDKLQRVLVAAIKVRVGGGRWERLRCG